MKDKLALGLMCAAALLGAACGGDGEAGGIGINDQTPTVPNDSPIPPNDSPIPPNDSAPPSTDSTEPPDDTPEPPGPSGSSSCASMCQVAVAKQCLPADECNDLVCAAFELEEPCFEELLELYDCVLPRIAVCPQGGFGALPSSVTSPCATEALAFAQCADENDPEPPPPDQNEGS